MLPLMKRWGPGALLTALVLLVWGQSISFQFVWDDKFFIKDLQSIRSLRQVPEMFYSLAAQSSQPEAFTLFRPLRTLHYAILYALGGDTAQPWLFHLANLVWHAAATLLFHQVLLLILGRKIGEKQDSIRWFAWLGAAAFAVHPVVSEVVCWAKSLDDLMATAFVLASCLALLRDQPEPLARRSYGWAVTFFILALYSKESAVPFALFCLPLLAWRMRRGWWPSLQASLPFFVAAFGFVVHRHLVIGRTSQTAPISGGYVQTLIDTLPAGPIYARLLAGIPPFCIDYSYMDSNQVLSTPSVMLGYALLAGLILGILLAWRGGQKLLSAGLLWFLVFMLPCSNLIPMMQYCAERFLYLPLLGWIAALTSLAMLIPRRNLSLAICMLTLVIWSGVAWQRSWIWRDPLTLFVQSHLEGPTTPRVQNNAISAAFGQPHLRAAFSRGARPGYPSEVAVSPTITNHPPDWPAVVATLAQLHQLFPDDMAVVTALGHSHILRGQAAEAIPFFERATLQHPDQLSFWSSLSRAQVAAGRDDQAAETCQRALARDASHLLTLELLATIQHRQEKYSDAHQTYLKLHAAAPDNREFAQRAADLERQLAALLTPAR